MIALALLLAQARAADLGSVRACDNSLLGAGLGEVAAGIGVANIDARKGVFTSASSASEAAFAEAEEKALADLRAKLCGALGPGPECDAAMGTRFATQRAVGVDPKLGRFACVVTGADPTRARESTSSGRAETALRSLGQALRVALRETGVREPVLLDVIRNPDGCTTRGLEAARQRLAGLIEVPVLPKGDPGARAWRVELEATLRGEDVSLQAKVVDPATGAGRALAPATFPRAAFAGADLSKTCAAPIRSRVGAGGLTARITMDAAICAGQHATPRLEVSKPARIQLWSVSPDGSALLLTPGATGWTGARDVGTFRVFPAAVPGDDTLLAVAVPESAPVTAAAPSGVCRVRTLDASRIPAGAAVAVQSWQVLTDPVVCPGVDPTALAVQAAQDQAEFARYPSCP